MANFERMFEDFFDSVNGQSTSVALEKSASMEAMDSHPVMESSQSLSVGSQKEFLLQRQIRPYFGKQGVNDSPIGTHPDFIALEGTVTTQNHYACTLFVDIKGSTRLSVLYPLDIVFKFKNAVIQTCVEIIRSFDGHVHRLMGDAVMAFFGGNSTEKEDAVADAINCSITLRVILEESIKPWMEQKGLDAKDFGFRVGCDFGDDHEVLWGSFGYQNVGEVSATGLPVDMASKLQGLASKNQTMLGQGLLDFVNWPEKYSQIKTRDKGGVQENLPVVTPNLTDNEGTPIDYVMRQLSYSKSLEFSALPRSFRERITEGSVKAHSQINFKCFTLINGKRSQYISASKFLDPNISLVFEVEARTSNRLNFPLKVVFKKTNHGKAVPDNERDIEQKEQVKYIQKKPISQHIKSIAPFPKVELNEATLYRGLHTMKCEVYEDDGALLFRDWIGVMIR
ncbi:nucleotide-binding domain-containing protein [Marinomonas sp. GJ51-6]|uniref:nucleotide-binding domain-containing protein n=1 Tax=Marinomonas sp. GJ51-6 TaxID=2992802 RepID=UPI00293416F2|nr:adenylate/guanylate cyclase domain-containing protein [Marinomonas sp. GJ51-6]WOD07664.1 adenylate/guanylate cyclase domain-containing protein [Marinomonas sp. GJ51-6]